MRTWHLAAAVLGLGVVTGFGVKAAPPAPAAALTPVAQVQPPAAASGSFTWPERGPVTQGFGCTTLALEPYDAACATRHFHQGIDIGARFGTPIGAGDVGVVTGVVTGCVQGNYGCGGGYGNQVRISHGNGYSTLYGHLSSVLVSGGQPVSRGQVIGLEGSTGASTGPHLHFGVMYGGRWVDPAVRLAGG